ncbi:MAG: ABC transporter permease [Candidatus Thermoplasmatota archaeon]|nr:ABC transporter permease [Candidatus Thermoplasmatota archaeon]
MGRTSSLSAYIVTRLILSLPMLIILLTVVFLVLRVLPGDPISAIYGGRAPLEVVERARAQLGLDKPLIVQYFDFMRAILVEPFARLLHLQAPTPDLGYSLKYTGQTVWSRVITVLPGTIELTIFGMLVAIMIGTVTGMVAGSRRDTPVDVGLRMYGIVAYVIPIFWLGLMLQLVFALWLGWLPPNGRMSGEFPKFRTGLYTIDSLLEGDLTKFLDAVSHLILPALALGIVISGLFTRIIRVNMLTTMRSDFVEAARARGIKERVVIYKHAFKNAMIPVITVMGLQFALLFSGAVLTEKTFNWPGMGTRLLTAITERDFPVVQGAIIVYAIMVVIASLAIDIINAFVDPRIKY